MNASVICSCKNRVKPLLISLQSWILFEEIKEIIIVDWSSDEPIDFILNLSPKIKLIRVDNQEFFNQPQPLNLALKLCTQELVLKVDSDYILNPYWNFFEHNTIDDTSFLCGDSDIVVDSSVYPYFKYLRGLLLVKRKFLEEVGGWNENMGEYYGGEDGEVEKRLELYGLTKKKINLDYTITHIPHSNKDRILNFKGYKNSDLNDFMRQGLSNHLFGNELEWNLEYKLAEYHIDSNIQMFYNSITDYYLASKTNWNIIKIDDQKYYADMKDMKIKVNNYYENKYWRGIFFNRLIEELNYSSYLELGVRTGEHSFNMINCPNKVGVDANPYCSNIPGVVCYYTDDYFANLEKDVKFDLIFIDACHEKYQVYRDFLNSLEHLSDNGIIILHDIFPLTENHTCSELNHNSYELWIDLVDNYDSETATFIGYPGDQEGTVGIYFNHNKNFDSTKIQNINHSYNYFLSNISKYIYHKHLNENEIINICKKRKFDEE